VVLSAGWTTLIASVSIAGFGLLFLVPGQDHRHHAHHGLGHHLEGMWLAFVLAAIVTAFFVRRIAHAIARQREEIATLREVTARQARLASVTTLAAGAAHELGSPLGTIAVAAHDARLALERGERGGSVLEDLKLILLEVDRCQEVLGQMAGRVLDGDDDRLLSASDLERGVSDSLGEERSPRVQFRGREKGAIARLPRGQTVQSVVALVRNALEASAPGAFVTVDIARDGTVLKISVVDQGGGIAEDLLGKIGDPFFTTKEPGRGLGLGVFLARAFAESRGGSLQIQSSPGNGTRATLLLPAVEAAAATGVA
jgi:two-component system sensor histidine kinase RegB